MLTIDDVSLPMPRSAQVTMERAGGAEVWTAGGERVLDGYTLKRTMELYFSGLDEGQLVALENALPGGLFVSVSLPEANIDCQCYVEKRILTLHPGRNEFSVTLKEK